MTELLCILVWSVVRLAMAMSRMMLAGCHRITAAIALLSVIDAIRIRARGDVRTGGFSCWQHDRSCWVSTVPST